mmetsp:Transcript_34861/g.83596  ORF Transcript_34861/g.83596 Transcript_34861/m.83596 type:complete len:87 (-) Transcript_34861:114-374(-)
MHAVERACAEHSTREDELREQGVKERNSKHRRGPKAALRAGASRRFSPGEQKSHQLRIFLIRRWKVARDGGFQTCMITSLGMSGSA